jgi:exonuclease III
VRIASLNLNRRLSSVISASRLTRWVEEVRPSILCCQEIGQPSHALAAISHLRPLTVTGRVACWCDQSLTVTVRSNGTDWQRLSVNGFDIHNIYLSPTSSAARCARLREIRSCLTPIRGKSVLLVGDFNLAPAPCDGWFGCRESHFTRPSERECFRQLLDEGLVDALSATAGREFTFQRTIRGQLSSFRCDLALISVGLAAQSQHDHSARSGPLAFTDHSAVIVDFPERWIKGD